MTDQAGTAGTEEQNIDLVVERDQTKSSRTNGFHLFYRETVKTIMDEANAENVSPPHLSEMSKIGAESWKVLDDATRKEWNKKAQKKREEDDCGQIEPLVCPVCNRAFKQRHNEYRYHVKNCSPTTCKTCQKEFKNKIALKKHSKGHDKSIICTACNKSFSSNQALKRHTQSVHETQSVSCKICNKTFSTQGNMTRHEKIHSK